jgi:threonyl-tRNA synthetase
MPESYQDSRLFRIRHSTAHIMAQALLEHLPDAKIAIGPPIEDGFYYDFDLPRALTAEDLAQIEARMKKIMRENHPFTVREVSPDEARTFFKDQPYKIELIDDLVNGRVDDNGNKIAAPASSLTFWTQDTFTDLCRGPHVENTNTINPDAFSISFKMPAGAYWRGDEKRQQLTRIYGTAWETKQELDEYLHLLEEAKRRDHRVIGEKLGLFTIVPMVGKGLPLWKPNGAIMRDTLERWLRQVQIDNGYLPVVTPHIGNIELYKTSGHYPYYKDSQFAPIQSDDEEFLLKPMNCPHHIMIYKSEMRSYRDLPVRYAEFGTVYRYEQSGELNGLTRVRGFTVDDAHLFVTPDQLVEEFVNVVKLIQYVFGTLGLNDFSARVGIRDPKSDKYTGEDALWEQATAAIIQACQQLGLPHTVEEGEAAFYGPKLDFIFRDVLKRKWQLGTVQVDYNLPARFDLEYVAADSSRQRPVMIHRAPFGSLERFTGILIEHFGGAFPAWLSPVQVLLVPITDKHVEYAQSVAATLRAAGLRVEIDDSRERMQKKIAAARERLIPWLLVMGDRDREANAVSVRLRTDEDLGQMPLAQFVEMASGVVNSKSMGLK